MRLSDIRIGHYNFLVPQNELDQKILRRLMMSVGPGRILYQSECGPLDREDGSVHVCADAIDGPWHPALAVVTYPPLVEIVNKDYDDIEWGTETTVACQCAMSDNFELYYRPDPKSEIWRRKWKTVFCGPDDDVWTLGWLPINFEHTERMLAKEKETK